MWNDVRPRLGFSRSRQAIATARAEARSAPYRLEEARRVTAVAAVLAAPAPPASSSLAERLRALVLTYWLSAASYGAESFATAQRVLGSPIGLLLLIGWSFAFWYHLCNGMRHLCWDIGWGFELKQVYATGWIVVGASIFASMDSGT